MSRPVPPAFSFVKVTWPDGRFGIWPLADYADPAKFTAEILKDTHAEWVTRVEFIRYQMAQHLRQREAPRHQ